MAELTDDADLSETESALASGSDASDSGAAVSDAGDSSDNLRRASIALVIVVVIDQLSKWWAESALELGSCASGACIDVVGPLRFNLHYNTGAAFSRGEGLGPLIAIVAVAMSVYLLWLAKSAPDRTSPLLFGTVAGGAVGNLIDRAFRADDGLLSGGVVDFIDFQFWPIFNIADAAIVCGIGVLLLHQLRESRRVEPAD